MKSASHDQQPVETSTTKPGFYYGYIIVLCAFISMVAILILPYSYGVFFKPMATELGWNRTVVSGAYSLSRIVAGLISIPMGILIDRTGARLVLIICGLVSGLGFLLVSQIDAIWQLFLVYGVIVGLGSGIFAPMVSLVAKWFVKKRAVMSGVVISGLGVATIVGPPVTNILVSTYGWRPSYIIGGLMVAAIVIIAAQFMRRDPHQTGQLVYGEKPGAPKVEVVTDSLSLRQALATRQFWMFCLMSFCYAFSYMGMTIHIVPYATDIGIDTASAASILATIGGTMVIGLVLMGTLGDKIGNKKTIIIGFILMSAAMTMLLCIKELGHFYLFAVIFGLAMSGISSQRPPMVATMFGIKSHGLIFGTIDNSFMLGAAAGPLMAGYLFDITGSYLAVFILNTAIAILGLILIISLRLKTSQAQGR